MNTHRQVQFTAAPADLKFPSVVNAGARAASARAKREYGSRSPTQSSKGQSISSIARELGVTRSWASREAHAVETGVLIDELVAQHWERISALLSKGRETLLKLFETRKVTYVRGKAFDLGPDHRVRPSAYR